MRFLQFASCVAGHNRARLSAAMAAALLLAGCQEEGHHRYSFDPALASARSTKPAQRTAELRAPPINAALLKAPKEPSCDEKSSGGEQDEKTNPVKLASTNADQKSAVQIPLQSDPNRELATRIRLEYDRECFKQAEKRVRAQLERLQAEVRGKILTATR
jgi:sensor domain CHASE-containing protein